MSDLLTTTEELRPFTWQDGQLLLLDQTMLPAREEWLAVNDVPGAGDAIRNMRVRGAPATGIAAAYAMALAARNIGPTAMPVFLDELDAQAARVAAARPTAVNLGWAVQRCRDVARMCGTPAQAAARILSLAHAMREDDIDSNRAIGRNGAALMPESGGILTHCNTGALATAGYGTALGVIRAAWESSKQVHVFCTETRPWLQGARLTAWELARLGIPSTLIVDSAAGALMASGRVGAVVTGADRIAANGDTANKIGTYSLAALAAANGIPFYVAAPFSTVDIDVQCGEDIPVEERPGAEVTSLGGHPIAAEGVDVWNPVFDVTPAALITGIITERGVLRAPYEAQLRDLARQPSVTEVA
ncbi:MAG: S-methyl-5-thioribose-1-phosphate isomerase [Chloroflexi bacterium]|nr:S-methyl-5-thioribose-1-phosphate isomerase [Chloroflexota bacterium]